MFVRYVHTKTHYFEEILENINPVKQGKPEQLTQSGLAWAMIKASFKDPSCTGTFLDVV